MQNEVQKKGRELRYCQLRLMIVEMDQTFIWQSKLVGKKEETIKKGSRFVTNTNGGVQRRIWGQFDQHFINSFCAIRFTLLF